MIDQRAEGRQERGRVMELIINGKSHTLKDVRTIADVVQHFGLDGKLIVVEHNREIVPRDQYSQKQVQSGDRIEIVHFVGGGK
jgi:sulfur carrier protein